MQKTLPKGHVSCLSSTFRYTRAADTNLASTFARIKRGLSGQEVHDCASPARVDRLPAHGDRLSRNERTANARQLLLGRDRRAAGPELSLVTIAP
jgi:hypothetical protein